MALTTTSNWNLKKWSITNVVNYWCCRAFRTNNCISQAQRMCSIIGFVEHFELKFEQPNINNMINKWCCRAFRTKLWFSQTQRMRSIIGAVEHFELTFLCSKHNACAQLLLRVERNLNFPSVTNVINYLLCRALRTNI